MKKVVISLTVFLFFITVCGGYAQNIFSDDFNYTAGQTLTANGWAAHSGAGTNALTVSAPSLSYTGYVGSGVGNAVAMTTSGEDCNQSYLAQTSGSIYYTCLLSVTSATLAGDYFMHFQTGATSFYGRLFVRRDASNNLAFGISRVTTTVNYTGFTYALNTTYLIVVKYTFNAGALNDTAKLFINPDLNQSEPTPTIVSTDFASTADATTIDRIGLRQGTAASASTQRVDGIRVSLSWGDGLLPVELSSFHASSIPNGVKLRWTTESEINNLGFEIERKNVESESWSTIGMVAGAGNSTVPQVYEFADNNISAGNYFYRLKQIDYNGNFQYYTLAGGIIVSAPQKFTMAQNYPNPFNPETRIAFSIPRDGLVEIRVYDISGKEVFSESTQYSAGHYEVVFSAAGLASGIYFAKISTGEFTDVKKMQLVK